MLFNSYQFLFEFLPVTGLAAWVAGRSGLAPMLSVLLLASLLFIGLWDITALQVLLASIVWNFIFGALIVKMKPRTSSARVLLCAAVIGDLGALGYYKYVGFAISTFNHIAGTEFPFAATVLPLGISFFMFHQIAYLVEAYRTGFSEFNPIRYALFVSFFPQLIAGPIVYSRDMLPQFRDAAIARLRFGNIAVGLTIFTFGLAKKVVLADNAATYSTTIFSAAAQGYDPPLIQAWVAALSYAFQIYFDFSGYSDMAIGLGRMFGIILPLNFFSPYKAASIVDFWRRWHITLSKFLRDYVYVPLGGNRKGHVRRYGNLLATMLLGGLWHGAGWTFIMWGGLHGLYLVVQHAWMRVRPWPLGNAIAVPLTFLAVVAAWVVFRADNLETAGRILAGGVGLNGVTLPPRFEILPGAQILKLLGVAFQDAGSLDFGLRAVAITALCAIVTWLAPNTQEIISRYHQSIDYYGHMPGMPSKGLRWTPTFGWCLVTAALLAASILMLNRPSEFIYFRF